MENLDLKCAEVGKQLAERQGVEETLITDALSVLQEHGVYAFFLYLAARGRQPGQAIIDACAELLRKTPAGSPLLTTGDVWQSLQRLSEDLVLRHSLVDG